MRELFDRLIAGGEPEIDRLVADRTQETVTLDFKVKADATTGTIGKEDRKVFAKALSAFSNSAGGVIVFGVEARKGPDDVDCAQALKPIAEIARFESEMRTASGALLQPRHDGVEVRSIPSVRQPGAGYLAVLVERSERRPHRSEAKDQKTYFKRAGDSSFEMEHYDIEDAFRRSSTSDLKMELSRAGHSIAGLEITATLYIYLQNTSSFVAKFPFLHIRNPSNCLIQPNRPPGYTVSSVEKWHTFSGTSDTVIHPGLKQWAGSVAFIYTINSNYVTNPEDLSKNISFDYRFGCENAPMISGRFEGTFADFIGS